MDLADELADKRFLSSQLWDRGVLKKGKLGN